MSIVTELWAAGVVGAIIGGIIVWLVMRPKRDEHGRFSK